jgi:hypothetical protein
VLPNASGFRPGHLGHGSARLSSHIVCSYLASLFYELKENRDRRRWLRASALNRSGGCFVCGLPHAAIYGPASMLSVPSIQTDLWQLSWNAAAMRLMWLMVGAPLDILAPMENPASVMEYLNGPPFGNTFKTRSNVPLQ